MLYSMQQQRLEIYFLYKMKSEIITSMYQCESKGQYRERNYKKIQRKEKELGKQM